MLVMHTRMQKQQHRIAACAMRHHVSSVLTTPSVCAGGSDCTMPPALWGGPGGLPAHLAPLAPFLDDPVPASFPGLDAGSGDFGALLVYTVIIITMTFSSWLLRHADMSCTCMHGGSRTVLRYTKTKWCC